MAVVVGPSNYVEPYTGVPKPAPLHVDVNGGLILGAGAVAALLGSVRIQDGVGASLALVGTTAADGLGTGNPVLFVSGLGYGFNGATWDRLSAINPNGDNLTPRGGGILNVLSVLEIFNGGTYDRARSASAANLGATSGLGAALVSEPGEWAISNGPAQNVQATATRAGVAGVRHILKSISAAFVLPAAGGPSSVVAVVRDGASGVGAILWQELLAVTNVIGSISSVNIGALHIAGTAGSAMTVEFTGAGGPGTQEILSSTGYDAS